MMAYMCRRSNRECDACGYCTSDWDENDNEDFRDDDYEEDDDEEEEDV